MAGQSMPPERRYRLISSPLWRELPQGIMCQMNDRGRSQSQEPYELVATLAEWVARQGGSSAAQDSAIGAALRALRGGSSFEASLDAGKTAFNDQVRGDRSD